VREAYHSVQTEVIRRFRPRRSFDRDSATNWDTLCYAFNARTTRLEHTGDNTCRSESIVQNRNHVLRNLTVQNFRSLRSVSVTFSPTGLTVIVGANGSGKSNLIKCLEFLGMIPREGLENTVRANNGVDAILPKALSVRNLRSTQVSFSYNAELPRPEGYSPDGPPILVGHDLVLQAMNSRVFTVREEKLTFSEPLRVQNALARAKSAETNGDTNEIPPSWLIAQRSNDQRLAVTATPPITGRHLPIYLEWFGLSFLKASLEKMSAEQVTQAIGGLFLPAPVENAPDQPIRRTLASLVDGSTTSALSFSPHASAFRRYMSALRRFDLQLSQLRRQQDIATTKNLTPDGRGLPAAVRTLRSNSGDTEGNWRRLSATLAELAPHVADTRVSQLKSGQEFVQFIEQRSGRPVESWQSSDGTLRALAILLAVETHPNTGAIMIEEPEQGLHPWAIRTLINHLREVIGERRIQVIVTTHSQQVLDSVEPEEVLVASRAQGEGTIFRTISEIAGKSQIERGEIGRMWVAGVLGGVPSYD
jgi:predicted ATPase